MLARHELEGLAAEVRRRAGLLDDDPILATRLAARLLGPDAVAVDPTIAGAAYLRATDDGWQILLNPAGVDVRFHVAHEIGEWALRELAHFRGSHLGRERSANYLAAAILAPYRALMAAYDDVELRHAAAPEARRLWLVASRFGLSTTSTVLRLAEVRNEDRAVVTRSGNVMLRAHGGFVWDGVPILAVARGQVAVRGLVKARLRGGIDDGRVALRAG